MATALCHRVWQRGPLIFALFIFCILAATLLFTIGMWQLTVLLIRRTSSPVAISLTCSGPTAPGTFCIASSCSSTGSCTAAFALALSSCTPLPSCTIQLAPGVYRLAAGRYSTQISATGLRNVAILGSSSRLVTSDISNTFSFTNCSNVTLSRLAIDTDRVPYTYGRILAVSGSVITLAFDDNLYPIDTVAYPWLNTIQAVSGFDAAAWRMARGGLDVYASMSVTYVSRGQLQFTLPSYAPPPAVGAALILRHVVYAFNALNFMSCSNVSVSDVSIYNTAGMGVYSNACSGMSITRLAVTRNAGYPMSITADGVHLDSCRGGDVILRDSVMEGQGDDGLNVPTHFQEVESIVITSTWANITVGKSFTVAMPMGQPGDVVMFYARASMTILGNAIIVSVDAASKVMSLTSLPTGVGLYDLVLNTAARPASVTLTNCTFRSNRARGALLPALNVAVTNCTFDHTSGPAVLVQPDGCFWLEGGPVSNWTFMNNRVTGCNYGAASDVADVLLSSCVPTYSNGKPTTSGSAVTAFPVHADVSILGNSFVTEIGETPVALYGVTRVNVTNNTVFYAGGAPSVDFAGYGCTNSSAVNNTCVGRPGRVCVVAGL